MSKWINVKCIAVKEVMVEIEDNETEDDAINTAQNEMSDYDDFTSESVKAESVDQYKRHADEVFNL